jgi:hypothetical protein
MNGYSFIHLPFLCGCMERCSLSALLWSNLYFGT